MNRMKEKSYIFVSVKAEKAFHKNQHHCMTKTLNKLGTEGNYFNKIKAIYEKPS